MRLNKIALAITIIVFVLIIFFLTVWFPQLIIIGTGDSDDFLLRVIIRRLLAWSFIAAVACFCVKFR
jgi:hypothetical protein